MQEEDILSVQHCVVEPNMCALNAPLSVAIQFTLVKPVANAYWELVYEADTANKRVAVVLARTEPVAEMPAGVPMSFQHTVPEIKTEGVKEKYLLQVGVLRLALRSGADANVAAINMISQVSKDPSTGALIRNIISPLE